MPDAEHRATYTKRERETCAICGHLEHLGPPSGCDYGIKHRGNYHRCRCMVFRSEAWWEQERQRWERSERIRAELGDTAEGKGDTE